MRTHQAEATLPEDPIGTLTVRFPVSWGKLAREEKWKADVDRLQKAPAALGERKAERYTKLSAQSLRKAQQAREDGYPERAQTHQGHAIWYAETAGRIRAGKPVLAFMEFE